MACIFCDIESGKSKSWKVYEDENCVAVLDVFPVTEGHMLILPKKHFKTLAEVDDEALKQLFLVAKKLALKTQKALGSDGFNITTAPSVIDHFHIHVIPRYDYDLMGPLADLDNKRELPKETMDDIAKKIKG